MAGQPRADGQVRPRDPRNPHDDGPVDPLRGRHRHPPGPRPGPDRQGWAHPQQGRLPGRLLRRQHRAVAALHHRHHHADPPDEAHRGQIHRLPGDRRAARDPLRALLRAPRGDEPPGRRSGQDRGRADDGRVQQADPLGRPHSRGPARPRPVDHDAGHHPDRLLRDGGRSRRRRPGPATTAGRTTS